MSELIAKLLGLFVAAWSATMGVLLALHIFGVI